jgi:hypothetical protein
MKNKKILVVFNCSGIIRNPIDMWESHLLQILKQDYADYDVCVSGCKISEDSKKRLQILKNNHPNNFHLIFFDEIYPVNVTFNKSCLIMSENKNFDAFLYVASDVGFNNRNDVLQKITDLHFSGEYGITSTVVNYDSGIDSWMGSDVLNNKLSLDNFIVPIGKTCNLHCMMFDKKIFESYGKILPDIFRSYCTESTFTFLTASVDLKFVIHKNDLLLIHLGHTDGSSGGFQGNRGWSDLYNSKLTVQERLINQKANEVGFGYEECSSILLHNKQKYDHKGNHINSVELLDFMKYSVFLSTEELNYNNINYTIS